LQAQLWEAAITSKDPVDAFFFRVAVEYERVKGQRSMLRSALGYAHRQRGPLTHFFDDGCLALTNNQSERELRRVAVGRRRGSSWAATTSPGRRECDVACSPRLDSIGPSRRPISAT
jgi:Transposase IS66 family